MIQGKVHCYAACDQTIRVRDLQAKLLLLLRIGLQLLPSNLDDEDFQSGDVLLVSRDECRSHPSNHHE